MPTERVGVREPHQEAIALQEATRPITVQRHDLVLTDLDHRPEQRPLERLPIVIQGAVPAAEGPTIPVVAVALEVAEVIEVPEVALEAAEATEVLEVVHVVAVV